jgi:hypothetical protein
MRTHSTSAALGTSGVAAVPDDRNQYFSLFRWFRLLLWSSRFPQSTRSESRLTLVRQECVQHEDFFRLRIGAIDRGELWCRSSHRKQRHTFGSARRSYVETSPAPYALVLSNHLDRCGDPVHHCIIVCLVSFNETSAFRFMQVSFAAYCNPQAIVDWTCLYCSDKAITVVRSEYRHARYHYSVPCGADRILVTNTNTKTLQLTRRAS